MATTDRKIPTGSKKPSRQGLARIDVKVDRGSGLCYGQNASAAVSNAVEDSVSIAQFHSLLSNLPGVKPRAVLAMLWEFIPDDTREAILQFAKAME